MAPIRKTSLAALLAALAVGAANAGSAAYFPEEGVEEYRWRPEGGYCPLYQTDPPGDLTETEVEQFPTGTLCLDSRAEGEIDAELLTIAGVSLRENLYEGDVMRVFGKTTEIFEERTKIGDANPYQRHFFCYVSEDGLAVFFIGNILSRLSSVWVGRSGLADTSRCAKSDLVTIERMSMGGLSVGMDFGDLPDYLGKPHASRPPCHSYCYDKDYFSGTKEEYSTSSAIELGFGKSGLDWFLVHYARFY